MYLYLSLFCALCSSYSKYLLNFSTNYLEAIRFALIAFRYCFSVFCFFIACDTDAFFFFSEHQYTCALQIVVEAVQARVGSKHWIFGIMSLYLSRNRLRANPKICTMISQTESFKDFPDCIKVCKFTSFDSKSKINESHRKQSLVTSILCVFLVTYATICCCLF